MISMKTIFFFDLDNTIYFTEPNKEVLMSGLYEKLDQEDLGLTEEEYLKVKKEMMRTPFLKLAKAYHFPNDVVERMVEYLSEREVTEALIPSSDYHYIKSLKGRKFIITAGFPKQQRSKVKMLGIAEDFEDVKVVDVSVSNKKDVFIELIKQYDFDKDQILVIGDDPESEIKAGQELGLETFLIDPEQRFAEAITTYRGINFEQLSAAAGQSDQRKR